jgi:uncharacterized repeat protein (TIGR04138 family)
MSDDPDRDFLEVITVDGRYPMEAYLFLQEGLTRAVHDVHGDDPPDPGARHVSGAQLCWALRDEARDHWGMLARTVLKRWHIEATIDFGNMVYVLVDNDLMQKTEGDSLEDFGGVFDFAEAFSAEDAFEIQD